MDLKGEYLIPAKKLKVWEHLNNPQTLKNSIKGCQTLDKVSETEFTAKVKAKIGPVSAMFNGSVSLTDLDPPNSYIITGQGKGGAAGFAKGSVKITLVDTDEPNNTLLQYEGSAQVGGKLAQLGSRLIGGVVKSTADNFFKTFNNYINSIENPKSNLVEDKVSAKDISKKPSIPYWIWIFSLIGIIGLILVFFA
jgi:carbon monoxide dehydrogenase subunit G